MATTTSQASTTSPKDSKSNLQKSEEHSSKTEGNNEESKSNTNAQPLAPPPKPSQNDSDYFGASHNNNAHFSLEPNPFEQSFGNPSTETPGKFAGLPSVASLTSPAPLGTSGTPGWTNSLRSGPLSPAMLPGPTPSNGDYFDSGFRQSFPTPNESSLRSGLTPGGGGSMFPAPSPNSQAIFNSMQSGGATPGTLEFHRTAMSAAARSKNDTSSNNNNSSGNMHGINKQEYQPAQQQQTSGAQNPFNNNSEHDAVNSLYMLANNGQRNANQFAMSNQQQGAGQVQQRMGEQSQDTSPTTQRGHKQSVGNLSNTTGVSENGDYASEGSVEPKASGKKGKKGGKANGRRKAEETPPKGSAKKSKGNDGEAMDDGDMSEDEPSPGDDDGSMNNNNSGKKLTDEEKRKNFLERNRVAALKCRQRKKQWLANLQQKVEVFTTENQELSSQNAALHEEIRSLKTLLLAHRDCPVSHQQGLGGAQMANILGGDFDHHNNPYGMSMGNNGNMMMQHQQGMQRR